MKTVSIAVEDAAWESMQRLAQAQGRGLSDLLSSVAAGLTPPAAAAPSPEERRRILSKLWERIDAGNVEVGERPSRARTYDHRRFHRH